jgi:hypothetical protein
MQLALLACCQPVLHVQDVHAECKELLLELRERVHRPRGVELWLLGLLLCQKGSSGRGGNINRVLLKMK